MTRRRRIAAACGRVVESSWSDPLMLAIIALNAVTLGLGTYDSINAAIGRELHVVNRPMTSALTRSSSRSGCGRCARPARAGARRSREALNCGSLLRVPYRPTERTEARRAAARERIVHAAHGLIARGGYREAQIAAVAAGAGVATGTVYRHFPSKADLFAEVFRRASQREVDATREAADAAGGTASQRLAAAVETFARRALRGRRLAWALIAEPVDPAVEVERLAFRRAYAAGFEDVLRAGVAAGELAPQNVALSAAALVGALGEALVGPLSWVGAMNDDVDADALVADLVAFALRAVTEETH